MADTEHKLRVFISYSRQDCTAFADELLEGLETVGFDAFLDRHDIVGGEAWETRLDNEVSAADTVVFVISPAAIDSEACQWEIKSAQARAKRVIPVVALQVDEAQIQSAEGPALFTYLKSLQFINFNTPHSFGGGLKRLTETLNSDLDWIREHTRIGGIAKRWDDNGRIEDLMLRGAELANAQDWMKDWKPPSPEPTELHRALINDSQSAEDMRNSEERARLEEVARLQGEREEDLKRFQKRIGRARIWLFGLGALAVAAGGAAAAIGHSANEDIAEANARIKDAEQKIEIAEAEIEAAQDKELDLEARLLEANQIIAASKETAVSQIIEQRRWEESAASGAAGPSAPVQQPAKDYKELRAAKIKAGWDIDVFYCAGVNEVTNKQRAENVKALLEEELDRQIWNNPDNPAQLNMYVGNVRVRTLSEKINASPSYSVTTDQIRSEAKEKEQANMVINYLRGAGGPVLNDFTSGSRTAWYLSIFMCSGQSS